MTRHIAAALATAVLLTACTGTFEATEPDPDAIDVFGPYQSAEADAFSAALDDFADRTGHEVRYTGSGDFVADLRARIDAGSPPDVAVVPQPGLVAELAANGDILALDGATVDVLDEHFDDRFALPGLDGRSFFIPYRSNVKSLVWYRPAVFEDRGWEVPESLAELEVLVDDITRQAGSDPEDGQAIAPWCFSVSAGSSSGWPATDWIEDLLVRQAGPEVYAQWIQGDVLFSDDELRTALETFRSLVLAPRRTLGGAASMLEVRVQEAGLPLFADPPGCALYKQASFATSWFPDGTIVGEDVDFFVLPAAEGAEPAPIIGGADVVVRFSERGEVGELMRYLASPDGARAWAERGGYTSARTSVDADEYYAASDARFAALLQDEERTVAFDGSDLMPPEFGSGVLWRDLTLWIAGGLTLDELITALDAGRARFPNP